MPDSIRPCIFAKQPNRIVFHLFVRVDGAFYVRVSYNEKENKKKKKPYSYVFTPGRVTAAV